MTTKTATLAATDISTLSYTTEDVFETSDGRRLMVFVNSLTGKAYAQDSTSERFESFAPSYELTVPKGDTSGACAVLMIEALGYEVTA